MNTRVLLPLVFLSGTLLAQVTYDRLLHADQRATELAHVFRWLCKQPL